LDVDPKNRRKTLKMDGEFIMEKPYFLMDDLGGTPTIFGNIHVLLSSKSWER